jgi:hypothetical protein
VCVYVCVCARACKITYTYIPFSALGEALCGLLPTGDTKSSVSSIFTCSNEREATVLERLPVCDRLSKCLVSRQSPETDF